MDKKGRYDYVLFIRQPLDEDTERLKIKWWKRHTIKTISNKKATAMLITVKLDFKTKSIARNKRHLIIK